MDGVFIRAVHQGGKSLQACSEGKGDSLSGAPFVFVRKGAGSREGVGSVPVGEVDPAGLI